MTTVTYRSPKSGELVTVSGTEVDGRYPDLYLTLDTDKGVLRIPRETLVVPERPYLVCNHCGEIFGSIRAASEHGFSDPSGSAGWCGEEGFYILPGSEVTPP